jgi:hypothetical protein
MSRLMYKIPASHVQLRDGVYYFVRRIPADLQEFYSGDPVSLSLRTKSISAADRSAKSISQHLDDYWMGLRLQKIDIPAIRLLKTVAKTDDGLLIGTLGMSLRSLVIGRLAPTPRSTLRSSGIGLLRRAWVGTPLYGSSPAFARSSILRSQRWVSKVGMLSLGRIFRTV